MSCRILEFKDKQVVSVKNGAVIGFVSDVEISTETGSITAIIASGRGGLGLFGGNNETVIPWDKIEVIGNDSILVNFEAFAQMPRKKKSVLGSLFFGE